MREINTLLIKDAITELFLKANFSIGEKMIRRLEIAKQQETSETAKYVLEQIIENDRIAEREQIPMCQDTGLAILFLEIGQEVFLTGQPINEAINEGVAEAYEKGYLRKSVVIDPLFNRINTKNNTPAIIYYDYINGDKIKINVLPKGAGSENMSQIKMLTPADGIEGMKRFVVECVRQAGPNPCPPIIVGVGVGGSFEKAALLSKKALMREIDETSHYPQYAELEKELLQEINNLNIGPAGLKGKTTCLSVNIEAYPTHIAALPVAVNIGCHAYRHAAIEI
ncbi:MAG: fumarate hydratase [Tissierellales bacterium]|nr:fumarate hydratase [Tissierellales bacterium]